MDTFHLSTPIVKNRKEAKNIFLYAAGKTISIFGTAIYSFALGLYVLKLTGSALSFAVTLILGIVPMIIINPLAGVIADKFNKRILVVSMDMVSGFLLVLVYFLSNLYGLSLILIYATTFLLTVCTTFFGVGVEAGKPNMVSEKMLMNINSVGKVIDSVSSISGPMLGGFVFVVFDIETFILINGISFILSGLSMLFIDFKLFSHQSNVDFSGGKIHLIQDVKDGFQYLFSKKSLMSIFILLITINFFLGFAVTIPLPYFINNILRLGSKEFGIIEGAFPLGMILGAVMVKSITEKISYSQLVKYLRFSLAIFMILSGLPVIPNNLQINPVLFTVFYCVVMFCFGVIIAFIDIPLAYFMQKEIPDEYRGRVLSISISIGKTMLPVAMIASGTLLNYIPAYIMPVAGGILFLLINLRSSNKIKIEINVEKAIS
ncbi:MFS transporter [Neobacillus sp. MM2021_6]|uniref:MFS transporter n=1 Tax=Bacillaceae TaxID=186817 RepID=UPI00140DA71D|nr:MULTISPECIES: MFS transporter [Bacillaceae]MBO0961208.1 MFS transporter [Neobacillus sp. MM2021_6]NHC20902.1 MFS transporter [Bacillus sp. MM2020_4]